MLTNGKIRSIIYILQRRLYEVNRDIVIVEKRIRKFDLLKKVKKKEWWK